MHRQLFRLPRPPLSSSRFSTRAAKDPYAVLGLPQDASAEQVKRAYYQLALTLHPDRHPESPDAVERFTEVGAAYTTILGDEDKEERRKTRAAEREMPDEAAYTPAPLVHAFPTGAHRLADWLHNLGGERLDAWLMPSYSRIIYKHLRDGELTEAMETLEDMKAEGEVPSHAVYEMLMRGCTIAMRRVGPGEESDHLTRNLIGRVGELWAEMEVMGRKPDYKTYNELIRAYGKAGRIKELMVLFEHMCDSLWLLPETWALNNMYEAHYEEALYVFEQQEEMRNRSLWRPRFTPVSFSLLLTACAEVGPERVQRMQVLPRVLTHMGRHGILPRAETCERLLAACVATNQLPAAQQVLQLARRGGHELDPQLLQTVQSLEEEEAARLS